MKCPKCGFEQPESKECAQCGIIIEKYQGRKEQGRSVTGKLFSFNRKTIFTASCIVLAMLILIGGVLFGVGKYSASEASARKTARELLERFKKHPDFGGDLSHIVYRRTALAGELMVAEVFGDLLHRKAHPYWLPSLVKWPIDLADYEILDCHVVSPQETKDKVEWEKRATVDFRAKMYTKGGFETHKRGSIELWYIDGHWKVAHWSF